MLYFIFSATISLFSYHPEISELKEKHRLLDKASTSLSKTLRDKLADEVLEFGRLFNEEYAVDRSRRIRKDDIELSSPLVIINGVQAAVNDIESAIDTSTTGYLSEEATEKIIHCHSALLGRLVAIRTPNEKADKRSSPWDVKNATKRLQDILKRFRAALELDVFDQDNARDLSNERRTVDQDLRDVSARLDVDLPKLARLHMSTIGSSHRLPGDRNNDESDLAHMFDNLSVEDASDNAIPQKKTVVVFDESGCIPSYELLGLTRLNRDIISLVSAGDKHQLPPYDPASTRGKRAAKGSPFNAPRSRQAKQTSSLLDASALTTDAGKIMLTTQYRVPKDIADMLNQRVYRGQYNTCPRSEVPLAGLRMVNVPFAEDPRRKYVNPNEVREGLDLLLEMRLDCDISSTLIITPVSTSRLHVFSPLLARHLGQL